ncbi:hypothetical protein D4759_07500 [Clostridiales bacterium AHG0011]|nr:hypothetical protein [Clostridiales bacterium AHG0011]
MKKIEGTKWRLDDKRKSYENPDAPGHFKTINESIVFENEADFINALRDTGKIFRDKFGFTDIYSTEFDIIWCMSCPVTIHGEYIGLNRTENIYAQDMYQFAHELMHFKMGDLIPQRYKWFEECLCSLSSIMVMNEAVKSYEDTDLPKALQIYCYIRDNYKFVEGDYNIVQIFNEHMNNAEKIYEHQFASEKLFARVLYGFWKNDLSVMHLVRFLPHEEYDNGFFYLRKWLEAIPINECGRDTLKKFVDIFANDKVLAEY